MRQGLHPRPGVVDLGIKVAEGAGVVDHHIGNGTSVLATGLIGHSRSHVILREAAELDETLDGNLRVDVDHHDPGQVRVPVLVGGTVGPHEQRDIEHDNRIGAEHRFALGLHLLADRRVDKVIECLQFVLIVENDLGDGLAVEAAIGRHDRVAPAFDHAGEDRTARGLQFSNDAVRVDQHGAPLHEKVGNGRLAGSDAAGESDLDHAGERSDHAVVSTTR